MRIVIFKQKENPLVTIIGISSRKIPYTVQSKTPNERVMNMPIDKSATFFSFIIFTIWGIDEDDVNKPAIIPIMLV